MATLPLLSSSYGREVNRLVTDSEHTGSDRGQLGEVGARPTCNPGQTSPRLELALRTACYAWLTIVHQNDRKSVTTRHRRVHT
jgi:hypothetical protein